MKYPHDVFSTSDNHPEKKPSPSLLQKIILGIFICFALLVLILEQIPRQPRSILVLHGMAFCRQNGPDTVQYTTEFASGEMIYLCGEAELQNFSEDFQILSISVQHKGKSQILYEIPGQVKTGDFQLEVLDFLPPGEYDLSVLHYRTVRLEKTITIR